MLMCAHWPPSVAAGGVQSETALSGSSKEVCGIKPVFHPGGLLLPGPQTAPCHPRQGTSDIHTQFSHLSNRQTMSPRPHPPGKKYYFLLMS